VDLLRVELLGEEGGLARAGAILDQWLGDGLIVGIAGQKASESQTR
jgi:hypothetical protein